MNFLDAAFRVCAELIHTAAHALAQASLRTRGTVPHSELLAAAGHIMRRAIPESPGGITTGMGPNFQSARRPDQPPSEQCTGIRDRYPGMSADASVPPDKIGPGPEAAPIFDIEMTNSFNPDTACVT